MGSSAEAKYTSEAKSFIEKVGELIAESGNILVYGAEKDFETLPTYAAWSAKKAGGTTIGITYGITQTIWGETEAKPSITIACGMERGGGREMALISSCDVIIAISGGAGTLIEMAIAYLSKKPIITIKGFGGWADKMTDTYFDARERIKCIGASTPQEAVELAMKLANY